MAKAAVAKAKAGKSGGARPAAAATREEIEKAGKPVLRTVIKSAGVDTFLTISDAKSDVVTWTSGNRITFSLRSGILIQTRGLGSDLMSAQTPSMSQLSASGSSYQRIYYFLGADDGGTRRTFDCTVSAAGRETIEIYGRSHNTAHMVEDCVRGKEKLRNDYWIEGASIRKSRQWASGWTGYIEFERVVD